MSADALADAAAAATLLLYGAAFVGLGLWAHARAKGAADFLLGARSLGPWVAGLAYAATSSSAWVLLGFSGFVCAAGPSALWMVPGILAGYLAVWLGIGPFLARAAGAGLLTVTDILADGASGAVGAAIRRLAAVMIGVAFASYIGAQLQGAGQALDSVFGVGLLPGIMIGAAVVLLYTWLGGFHAVALVDTLQGVAIALAAAVLPTLAFIASGGIDGIGAGLATAPDGYLAPFGRATGWAAAGFVAGLFATGFGALGQPHLAAWIMAARDRSARLRGAVIATAWATGVYGGMAVLGLSARALFGADAPPEGVLFRLADMLLPPVFAGLVTAAVLSAIMSTVDSQLLVASAAVARDLPARPGGGEGSVRALRLAMIGLCGAAVVVTVFLPQSIFDRTLFAWTALGAGFGPVLVARAAGWRGAPEGVLAALLASFSASLAFEFVLSQGPGAVWARTAPWLAGFAGLAAGPLLARWTSRGTR